MNEQLLEKLVDSAINWSYIAGFFDGEGCIVLNTKEKGIGCRISIINTDFKALTLIDKFLQNNGIQGHLNVRPQSKPIIHTDGEIYKSTKPCYHWRTAHRVSVAKFLQETLPYLIVKKDKAIEALNFIRAYYDPRHLFTTEQLLEIHRMVLSGLTTREIAKKFEVSHSQIERIRSNILNLPHNAHYSTRNKPLNFSTKLKIARARRACLESRRIS